MFLGMRNPFLTLFLKIKIYLVPINGKQIYDCLRRDGRNYGNNRTEMP